MNLKETEALLISQAEQLERQAGKLREAAAVLHDGSTNGFRPSIPQRNVSPQSHQKSLPVPSTSPKLKLLGTYLKTHGPSIRRDIQHGTELKSGTLSFLLNFKEYFQTDESGRWSVKDPGLFPDDE